jgi:hypothetical protein
MNFWLLAFFVCLFCGNWSLWHTITALDLKFVQQCGNKCWSSELLCCVAFCVCANVSEKCSASIFWGVQQHRRPPHFSLFASHVQYIYKSWFIVQEPLLSEFYISLGLQTLEWSLLLLDTITVCKQVRQHRMTLIWWSAGHIPGLAITLFLSSLQWFISLSYSRICLMEMQIFTCLGVSCWDKNNV